MHCVSQWVNVMMTVMNDDMIQRQENDIVDITDAQLWWRYWRRSTSWLLSESRASSFTRLSLYLSVCVCSPVCVWASSFSLCVSPFTYLYLCSPVCVFSVSHKPRHSPVCLSMLLHSPISVSVYLSVSVCLYSPVSLFTCVPVCVSPYVGLRVLRSMCVFPSVGRLCVCTLVCG